MTFSRDTYAGKYCISLHFVARLGLHNMQKTKGIWKGKEGRCSFSVRCSTNWAISPCTLHLLRLLRGFFRQRRTSLWLAVRYSRLSYLAITISSAQITARIISTRPFNINDNFIFCWGKRAVRLVTFVQDFRKWRKIGEWMKRPGYSDGLPR